MFRRRKITLESGSVRFVVPIVGKPDAHWNADIVTLKILAEELEVRHQLKAGDNGCFQATGEFLADLARVYESSGCPDGCTPTLARQIWIAVGEQFGRLDSRFRRKLARAVR